MDRMHYIAAGFATLLFSSGMSAPGYVNGRLAALLTTVRERSVCEALSLDQFKLSADLQRAKEVLVNEYKEEENQNT